MKTIITILLAAALLQATMVRAETTNDPPTNGSVLLGALVISAAVIGLIIIIKVNATVPSRTSPVTLVLERSYYDGNWVPLATNTVILNGLQPVEVFRQYMTDEVACYRARVAR